MVLVCVFVMVFLESILLDLESFTDGPSSQEPFGIVDVYRQVRSLVKNQLFGNFVILSKSQIKV